MTRPVAGALPAPLGLRLVAIGLDCVPVAAYIGLLTAIFLGLGVATAAPVELLFQHPWAGQLAGITLLTLPVILYFAAWERSSWLATPAKRLLGLRVVPRDGAGLGWARALARSGLKFLPWELAHTCIWRIPRLARRRRGHPSGRGGWPVTVWVLVGLYLLLPLATPPAVLARAVRRMYNRCRVVRTTKRGIAAMPNETPRRKNYRLHQSKIDRVREILHATTETEAIEAALDLVILREELVRGIRDMDGAELVDVFDAPA